MIFENGRSTHMDIKIYNTTIELVKSFKYLGVHLFSNGSFQRSQKLIAQHASFSLHKLFQIFDRTVLPTSQKIKLFDILVGSILNYCSEVWGLHPASDIELVHTRFLRNILGVKKSTNLAALYGELGRVPMFVMRKYNMIKYWNKLITLDNDSIVKKVYNNLKLDDQNNLTYKNRNWVSQIKQILNEHGFGYVWLSQKLDNTTLQLIKQRIFDNYYQKWYSEINNSSKLKTYAIFKHEFKREKYLDTIKENYLKTALAKFRVSAHQLAIETGRYTNIPQNERLCKSCNMQSIETEYHFLLVCPKYRTIRSKFFKSYYCHWPSLNKFENIMCSSSKNTLYNLAKFIFSANKIRIV
jgi:hypothetical protein